MSPGWSPRERSRRAMRLCWCYHAPRCFGTNSGWRSLAPSRSWMNLGWRCFVWYRHAMRPGWSPRERSRRAMRPGWRCSATRRFETSPDSRYYGRHCFARVAS